MELFSFRLILILTKKCLIRLLRCAMNTLLRWLARLCAAAPNPKLPTGTIEIKVSELRILSKAETRRLRLKTKQM